MLAGIRGRAVDLGFAAGWAALRTVPEPLSARAFRAGADYAAVRNGKGAQQLRRNLRRVLGPSASELRLDRLVGDALRSYSRYWLETFRLPEMDHADAKRHIFKPVLFAGNVSQWLVARITKHLVCVEFAEVDRLGGVAVGFGP